MAAEFHEVRFPLDVSLGSRGGPVRRTDVVTLASGREHRNSRWAHARRRYDAGLGVRTLDALHAVIGFFEERRGRLHGFRFRDRVDHRSGPPSRAVGPFDQRIGTGDGTTRSFPLLKLYGAGASAYARPIAKPVGGTVRVAVAGVEQAIGPGFACDPATGVVTFPTRRPGPRSPPASSSTCRSASTPTSSTSTSRPSKPARCRASR
jgi:uncharacterized protein (TIGR02217 family)